MDNIIHPFQIPIYQSYIDKDSFTQIKKNVSSYIENYFESFEKTWNSTTKTSIFKKDNRFKDIILENQIYTHIQNYSNSWGFKDRFNLKITECWVNVAQKGDFQENHNHVDSSSFILFSGVLYINIPKNSGNILFSTPISHTPYMPNNSTLLEKFGIIPSEGLLLLFPSWLEHSVLVNQNNNPRISVSFNLKKIN